MKRTETYLPTNDDWCPNFEGDKVRVSLLTDMNFGGRGIWHRVCVWGSDDDGMEIDFDGEETKSLAEEMYKKIISLPYVDKPILKKWGFVRA